MDKTRINELKKLAAEVRLGALEAVFSASSGHPGGSLSIADVLTYLYFEELRIDVKNPKWEDRDRFVLSKGHCTPSYYAVLAERGFFPREELKNFRQADSFLQGHPDMKGVPGCDMTTGSLGLGVSAACGMALSGKIRNKDYRVYAVLGDGETEEGQVWEAAMFAAHYKLDNLCIFVDVNGLQIDGFTKDVIGPEPLDEKYKAFGWNVITLDADDFEAIDAAVKAAKECKGKPTCVCMRSVKGKGVSFMENNVKWHGSAPNAEQYEQAVADIKASVAGL